MFIDFRNISVREKDQLVAFHMRPEWGLNPQPRYVPWPGIELAIFQCTGRCSNKLSDSSQGSASSFLNLTIKFSFILIV